MLFLCQMLPNYQRQEEGGLSKRLDYYGLPNQCFACRQQGRLAKDCPRCYSSTRQHGHLGKEVFYARHVLPTLVSIRASYQQRSKTLGFHQSGGCKAGEYDKNEEVISWFIVFKIKGRRLVYNLNRVTTTIGGSTRMPRDAFG